MFPQINYEQFAVFTGYPSVTNARKRFGEVQRRVRTLVLGSDDNGAQVVIAAMILHTQARRYA